MNCIHCGNILEEDAKFCTACGAPVDTSRPFPQTPRTQPPVLEMLKSAFTDNKAIALMITLALSTVLGLIADFSGGQGTAISYYLDAAGLQQVSDTVASTGGISDIMEEIPMILILAGMFMTWKSAKENEAFQTTGLKLIRIILYIELVLSAVVLVMSAITLITLSVMVASAYEGIALLLAGAGIILLIVLLLSSLYYIFLASSVKTMVKAAAGQMPYGKISMFVIVWSWINGIGSLIGGAASFVSGSAIGGLGTICGAAASILLALLLQEIRKNLQQAQPVQR